MLNLGTRTPLDAITVTSTHPVWLLVTQALYTTTGQHQWATELFAVMLLTNTHSQDMYLCRILSMTTITLQPQRPEAAKMLLAIATWLTPGFPGEAPIGSPSRPKVRKEIRENDQNSR